MRTIRDRLIAIVQQRTWVSDAIALGWSERELLGVHPKAPRTRLDCQGIAVAVAMQTNGEYSVHEVLENHLVLIRPRAFKGERKRDRMRIHPRQLPGSRESVPFWELLRRGEPLPDNKFRIL